MDTQWAALTHESAHLWNACLTHKAKMATMLHQEKLTEQNIILLNDLSIPTSTDEHEDVEVLLFIEDLKNNINNLDSEHANTMKNLSQQSTEERVAYANRVRGEKEKCKEKGKEKECESVEPNKGGPDLSIVILDSEAVATHMTVRAQNQDQIQELVLESEPDQDQDQDQDQHLDSGLSNSDHMIFVKIFRHATQTGRCPCLPLSHDIIAMCHAITPHPPFLTPKPPPPSKRPK